MAIIFGESERRQDLFMSLDYNTTVNLPKTEFSMRAGLPQKEPQMLEAWKADDQYARLLAHNEGKPRFILHDGPPYANGNIHTGHALNKILKDFIVRYKNMTGFCAPYVPGWDTHGLPIERQASKILGVKSSDMDPLAFRKVCHDFAMENVNMQKEQFKRLGIIGDWDNPYLTLAPEFEAKQIEIFGEMVKKGYIYKGLKPVYWCAHDATALAEAEIEYENDPCTSIYVKFRVDDDKGIFAKKGIDKNKVSFVIWTTTTWTLPGNLAVCLGPDFAYSLIEVPSGEIYVVAEERVDELCAACSISDYKTLAVFQGRELERMTTKHPFLDRDSLVIIGDHVTLESGTGCVHTAPGHGVEDFAVCKEHYPELSIVVPVDKYGRMTEEAGTSAGLKTSEANKVILAQLTELGSLLGSEEIVHQYPHCWRCKTPILFRATEQWFASVDAFKDATIDACRKVEWLPEWGEERIVNMVRDRSDWCISRQRIWGVPIPVFYCENCDAYHVDDASIAAVVQLFSKEGSDGWYAHSAAEILPAGTTCKACGGTAFRKETDIMDVWFDSGSSHRAVLTTRDDLCYPSDVYLEGNDQYRGWFQSSVLTAIATTGQAPYKTVITHGMVVDGEGKKMSKSLGNSIDPIPTCDEYGADILRLWVSSLDYRSDVRLSKEILKQLSEIYRKIRNTARFILGNLSDFDPALADADLAGLCELDRYALLKLNKLVERVLAAYERYEFHIVYHAVHNFCVLDMSNFYLDIVKDRLYTEKADSKKRRDAQIVMYKVLTAITKLLAPILVFTGEEIWRSMPHQEGENVGDILLSDMISVDASTYDTALEEKFDRLLRIREDVKKALEIARTDKVIGSSLEAKVSLFATGDTYSFLQTMQAELPSFFIVSQVALAEGASADGFVGELPELSAVIAKAEGEKCERCWIYSTSVGENAAHPTLCARCAAVVS